MIRAPFPARVAETHVEQDQFVGVGAALGRLNGVARAEIDAQLPQARMRDFVRLVFDNAAAHPTAASPAAFSRLSAEIRLRVEDETVVWPASVSRPTAGSP